MTDARLGWIGGYDLDVIRDDLHLLNWLAGRVDTACVVTLHVRTPGTVLVQLDLAVIAGQFVRRQHLLKVAIDHKIVVESRFVAHWTIPRRLALIHLQVQ